MEFSNGSDKRHIARRCSRIFPKWSGIALTEHIETFRRHEDRRKLDDAVRVGTLTGDEVAKGLTTRLKRIDFAQSGVDVATVDLDSEAANRALGGAVLLQRGQRRSDTPMQPDNSPIRVDKPSASPSPATGRDAQANAYFLAIQDGGDDASKKIADLGINLSPFAAFGDAVRRLIGKGAFDYR